MLEEIESHRTLSDLGKLCQENDHYYMIGDLMPGRGAGGVAGQIGMELKELILKGFVESVPIGKPVPYNPPNGMFVVYEAYHITEKGRTFLEKNPYVPTEWDFRA